MNEDILKKGLEISKKAARSAGKVILEIYKSDFKIEYKKDNSPVTEADKRSNELILSDIQKEFPDHSILSEEYEDDKSRLKNEWCWIIDPLDGTKEFLKRNDEFTVNIALSYKHRVVLGVVYLPVNDKLYFASKGKGAYLETNNVLKKIKVSDKKENLILIKSRSHSTPMIDEMVKKNKSKISEIICAGSSLKGCLVAEGTADIYYRFGYTSEWDTAAVQCVVEEAGGIFRQLDDTEMIYNRENCLNEKGFYILNNIENRLIIN